MVKFVENTTQEVMRYATVKANDVANGPGVRVTLFVQGCPHHCPGCFNSETWEFDGGEEFTAYTMDEIIEIGKRPHINGLSILGGEPFAQNLEIIQTIIEMFKEATGKSVWMWSGYLYEELMENENARKILSMIDVLVDGPFIESKKDLTLKHRGSSNQRVFDLKNMNC